LKRIVERVRGGLRRAKAEGIRLGRLAGSKVDSAKVGRLLAEGQSFRQTAKALGCSAGTIHRLAKQSHEPSSVPTAAT
jgi:DNA invertase Pin-like site-specific DNA recombinase